MKAWDSFRHDIARLAKCVTAHASLDCQELWERCREVAALRKELEELLGEQQDPTGAELRQELLQVQEELRQHYLAKVAAVLPEQREQLRAQLEQTYQSLARELDRIISTTGISPELAALGLRALSGEFLTLRSMYHILAGQPDSQFPDLLAELCHLEWQIENVGENGVEVGDLQKMVAAIRKQAILKQAELFENQSPQLLATQQLELVWEGLRSTSNMLREMAVLEAEAVTAKQGLQSRRRQLREKLAADLKAQPSSQAYALVNKWSLELLDHSDEIFTWVEDVSLPMAIASLALTLDDLQWQEQLLQSYAEEDEKAQTRCAPRLKKAVKRFRVELQEKKLQGRLEGIFGHRFVAAFESLILVLIMLVIVLLAIEWSVPLDHSTRRIFLMIDAGICFIFLTEFFTKLALVEGRWSYFGRHFIVDFFPSIPFGLIFSGLQQLNVARSARVLRFVRLSRLLRYLRILRPLVRIFRLFTFLLRGSDRLVRHYGRFLNRNIVLFASAKEIKTRQPSLRQQIQQARGRALRRCRTVTQNIPPAEQPRLLAYYLEELQTRLRYQRFHSQQEVALAVQMEYVESQDTRLEEVIDNLINLNAAQVEDILGVEFPTTLNRFVRYFNLPLIRRLPLIKPMVRMHQQLSPPQFAAWVGRSIGRLMQRVLSLIYWFTDLHGTITGPQLLDRLGLTMVQYTARPAKRLLMFGFLFLFLSFLVNLFGPGYWFTMAAQQQIYLDKATLSPQLLTEFQRHEVPLSPQAKIEVRRAGQEWLICDDEQIYSVVREKEGLNVYGFGWIAKVLNFLTRFLGKPIIILGGVCLIPLLLGLWLRRIAGEATDFYERAAEAQFLSLLKSIKEKNYREDLMFLYQRVLRPETMLRYPESPPGGDLVIRQMIYQLTPWRHEMETHPDVRVTTLQQARRWSERDRVLLLYQDYLSGALLHRNDTTTTRQILGNMTLENIRTQKVRYTRKDRKRLASLDLERSKAIFTGPYLWFNFITQSITQQTAKLIVDYNRHCIPQEEFELTDSATLKDYHRWLKTGQIQKTDTKVIVYRTTLFSALHFLSVDPGREETIRYTFGQELYQRLVRDRRNMIRQIFGTYPFHKMPETDRTFNVFELYQKYMAGGQIFLLPFRLFWWSMRILGWSIKKIYRTVKETLHPTMSPENDSDDQVANFEAAQRKIHRMRKPAYMECMKLRALYDVEYLGLTLPGRKCSGLEGQDYTNDLSFIGALDWEWDIFRQLREKRRKALREFDAFLTRQQWKGEGWRTYLASIDPALSSRSNEILRALAIAYVLDFQQLRSLLIAHQKIEFTFEEALRRQGRLPEFTWRRRLVCWLRRLCVSLLFLRRDAELRDFDTYWEKSERSALSAKEKRFCWRGYLSRRAELRPLLRMAADQQSATCQQEAEKIIVQLVRNPSSWTEEIIAIRTVQSLAVMDVRNYRNHIYRLGVYED